MTLQFITFSLLRIAIQSLLVDLYRLYSPAFDQEFSDFPELIGWVTVLPRDVQQYYPAPMMLIASRNN